MTGDTDRFEYERSISNGFERCVWCGVVFGAEDEEFNRRGEENPPGISGGSNWTYGPVRNHLGVQQDHVIDTTPGSYLMHPDCYTEYHTEIAQEENQTLDEFVGVVE